jgi:hypothetical protein
MPDFMGASLPFQGEQKESQTLSPILTETFSDEKPLLRATAQGTFGI